MAHVKTITEVELQKLLEAAKWSSFSYKRDYSRPRTILMILLMSDSGLRVGELVKLRWYDLLVEGVATQVLRLQANMTKTMIAREIPTTPRLRAAIASYNKAICGARVVNLEHIVFFGNSAAHHVSTRQVRRIIAELSLSCLQHKISPHTLRHTFATRLLRFTSTRVVQELLGHKSLSSTQVYTHPNSVDLRSAIDQLPG